MVEIVVQCAGEGPVGTGHEPIQAYAPHDLDQTGAVTGRRFGVENLSQVEIQIGRLVGLASDKTSKRIHGVPGVAVQPTPAARMSDHDGHVSSVRFLSNSIDTRKERESDDIRQVLDDLDKALRAELVADREPQQLSLFSEDERTQLRRDHAALEARLARIPLEREQEVRAIENRYSNVRDHTFPVAVILLVPESLTKGQKGTNWRSDPAEPLPIDDRTVLLLLEAIQTFEGRTLSYRALDVEQIGHVYEGLLERTVQRVDDVTLELDGSAKAKNARVALGEIESARLDGAARIVDLLKERSERSEPAIRNAIGREPDERVAARLLTVCRGDVALRDRILPYAELLRTDPWGYPLVHHAGAFVVVLGADRRESGTHYTPKSLTEKIVEETLTPIVYRGPAEGAAREDWKLKSADELLDLKVCDPAMGSGAFLVQVCRWLADRLVEAWSGMEAAGNRIDDEGRTRAADDTTGFEPLSRDTEERASLARRLIAEGEDQLHDVPDVDRRRRSSALLHLRAQRAQVLRQNLRQ